MQKKYLMIWISTLVSDSVFEQENKENCIYISILLCIETKVQIWDNVDQRLLATF